MSKKKISSFIKNIFFSTNANNAKDMEDNPLKFFQNRFYLIQFIFNIIHTLTLYIISSFNIAFKYISAGNKFTPSIYILLFVNALNLLLIVIYYLIYKIKCKHDNPNMTWDTILVITKFAIKVLKLSIPITLLVTLSDAPVIKITTIVFSIISLTFGFVSFIIGLFHLINYFLTYNTRLEKKQKGYKRYQRFYEYYQGVKANRISNNKENINNQEDTIKDE